MLLVDPEREKHARRLSYYEVRQEFYIETVSLALLCAAYHDQKTPLLAYMIAGYSTWIVRILARMFIVSTGIGEGSRFGKCLESTLLYVLKSGITGTMLILIRQPVFTKTLLFVALSALNFARVISAFLLHICGACVWT